MERLTLWYYQTDLKESAQGPAVAGRLSGRPFNLAMKLRFTLPDGRTLDGADALSHEGYAADPQAGLPASKTGLQRLLEVFKGIFDTESQQTVSETLDAFFDHRRGRLTLLEYITEHDYTYDEAHHIGGLELNNIGKSHFLLKHSGLDKSKLDHILLLVNNDFSRYDEIKGLLTRMAKSTMPWQMPGPHGY